MMVTTRGRRVVGARGKKGGMVITRTIEEWCCSLASASPPWAQSAQAGHDGASAVVAAEAVKGV